MLHRLSKKVTDRVAGHSQHTSSLYKSCIYFSNWSVYARKHFPNDIAVENVTHIFYAFIGMDNNTGALKLTDEWADTQLPMDSPRGDGTKVTGSLLQLYELKKMHRHLKVCMSIGGWGTSASFKAIMSNSSKMNKFVQNCVELIEKFKFDGVDIDWEYPEDTREAQQLVDLLRLLRMELNKLPNGDALQLTVASPAGDEQLSVMKLKEMDRYLSFWNVMCYDFAGNSWSERTGFHSNLFGSNGDNSLNSADITHRYINSGIASQKLVLGMPCYGRCFYNTSHAEIGNLFKQGNSAGGEDTVDYKLLPLKNTQEKFDSRKVSAFCYDPKSRVLVTYDNQQSAKIKAKYVELNNLGGGMWWDSCGDNSNSERSLVLNFVDQLGGVEVLDKSQNNLG